MFKDNDFKKASACMPNYQEACVEVAVDIHNNQVGVRDSKRSDKHVLVFNQQEWRAFIKGVKRGEFDV